MRFLLIDRILALEPGRSIHAVKTMPPDEELFQDHFPGLPVVPGVLLVEMMGQAAAKCLVAENYSRGLPILVKIVTASFREPVAPGQLIDLHAEIISSRPQFATVKARAGVAGALRATAELMFGFVPRDRFPADYRDAVLDAYLDRSQPRD